MWGSGPCQPFTTMRAGSQTEALDHKLYNVTFGSEGSVLSSVARVLPQWFGTEQVLGFEKNIKGTSQSPKDKFLSQMMSITREDGSEHFASNTVMKLDAKLFVKNNRPRYSTGWASTCKR